MDRTIAFRKCWRTARSLPGVLFDPKEKDDHVTYRLPSSQSFSDTPVHLRGDLKMARHTLGFDRLESRQMLVADGYELMAASYDPLAVAGTASPASDVLASYSFLPRVQISQVKEPINGVVYVMHYSGVWVKGDNDVQMFLGTSWWTTLPGTQGGGSQDSHADEGTLGGSASTHKENSAGVARVPDAHLPLINGLSEAESAATLAAEDLDNASPSEPSSKKGDNVFIERTEEVLGEELLYGEQHTCVSIAEEEIAGSQSLPVKDELNAVIENEINTEIAAECESECSQ